MLPDSLRLGPVELTVADLARSVDYYQGSLGLHLHGNDDIAAQLGDGDQTTLILREDPRARPAGRHAGLFHFALLYPERQELARAAVRLSAAQVGVTGASDHRTHEAIYLRDPDGNGIELAADRPRSAWPENLGYDGGPEPLDLADLLRTVEGEPATAKVGPGLRMGHLHLHVGDIADGLRFYRDVIGFAEQANLGTAAFVSAGGYHHHLGINVWNGEGVGPAPEHTAGLNHWTAELDTSEEVAEVRRRAEAAGAPVEDAEGGFLVRDPWGTALRFVAA